MIRFSQSLLVPVLLAFAPLAFAPTAWMSAAHAQATRQATGPVSPAAAGSVPWDGMVRSLMDSQRPRIDPRSLGAGGGSVNLPANSRGVASAARVQPSPAQFREIRANLTGFAQELTQLIGVLHQDANRTAGLRSLMGEALQTSAQASLLAREASVREGTARDDFDWIAAEFSRVDQDWRLLAFRLQKLRNLSPQAAERIERASQFSQRIGQLLQVQPQLDDSRIAQQASSLSVELIRLLEDIDYDVSDASARYNLLLEGRRVYEQSRRIGQTASRPSGPYATQDELRLEYDRFRALWTPYVSKLRSLELSYVDRQMQRVQAADRGLQELLLLPTQVDRSELLYLAGLLQRDIDGLMDGLSLRSLSQLPRGRDRIVTAASEFHDACSDFADCLRNGEDAETMAQVYYYLETNWNAVAEILREAPATDARQAFRQLDRSVQEVRTILAVQPTLDRQRAAELAAELDNLASYYEFDVRGILAANPQAYPANARTAYLRVVQEFRSSVAQLQNDLQSGARLASLRELTNRLGQQWNAILQQQGRFNEADREPLERTRSQLTPVLIDLQAMFAS